MNYISTLCKTFIYVCSKTISVFQMLVFVENFLESTEVFRCKHTYHSLSPVFNFMIKSLYFFFGKLRK